MRVRWAAADPRRPQPTLMPHTVTYAASASAPPPDSAHDPSNGFTEATMTGERKEASAQGDVPVTGGTTRRGSTL
jgi:hypothetical protein